MVEFFVFQENSLDANQHRSLTKSKEIKDWTPEMQSISRGSGRNRCGIKPHKSLEGDLHPRPRDCLMQSFFAKYKSRAIANYATEAWHKKIVYALKRFLPNILVFPRQCYSLFSRNDTNSKML